MTSGLAYKFLYGSGVTVSVYCAANFLLDHVAEFIVVRKSQIFLNERDSVRRAFERVLRIHTLMAKLFAFQ